MKFKTKYLCIVLCVCVLTVCFSGCTNNQMSNTNNQDNVSDRPLANKPQEETPIALEYTSDSVSWSGPAGYQIVIPHNHKEQYEKAAEILKSYFLEKYEVELTVVTDDAEKTKKEILIGNTNRTGGSSLSENEYAVTFKEDILSFESGHWLGVNKAVKWFSSLDIEKGKINTLKGSFDFASTVNDTYKYVWGDEFDGNSLDNSKWVLGDAMKGTGTMTLSDKPEVISVADGQLKLNAIHYFDSNAPQFEYAVPYSLMTNESMAYAYGYLEMKAMVPFKQGAWPSLWMNNKSNKIGPARTSNYFVEVDIFEIFSSIDTVSPNIHKWYDNSEHSSYGETREINVDNSKYKNKTYVFDKYHFLSEEYHVYGFEWTPTEMSMYVDGNKYMTYDLTFNFDGKSNMNGFSEPQALIINNHIYAPDSASGNDETKIANSSLPCNYSIEYIRLYQKEGEGKLYTK